jgi:hypothetical protein
MIFFPAFQGKEKGAAASAVGKRKEDMADLSVDVVS